MAVLTILTVRYYDADDKHGESYSKYHRKLQKQDKSIQFDQVQFTKNVAHSTHCNNLPISI